MRTIGVRHELIGIGVVNLTDSFWLSARRARLHWGAGNATALARVSGGESPIANTGGSKETVVNVLSPCGRRRERTGSWSF
jgi:hypothetical protein